MLDVHLILNQLDDGKDEVGIPQPAEHIIENRQVLILHTSGNAMRERCQYHARHLWETMFHGTCYIEGIIVSITRHTDHQVDIRAFQYLSSLLRRTHLCESRWITKSEFRIFVEDLLIHTSVIFQHEGIIGIGDDQDIVDTSCHQIDERHILQDKLVPLLWHIIFHR